MEIPQRTYTSKGEFKPDQLAEIANRAEIAIDIVRNSLANLELLDLVKDDLKTIKQKIELSNLQDIIKTLARLEESIILLRSKPSIDQFLGLSNRISMMEKYMASQQVVKKKHWWNSFLDYFKVNS